MGKDRRNSPSQSLGKSLEQTGIQTTTYRRDLKGISFPRPHLEPRLPTPILGCPSNQQATPGWGFLWTSPWCPAESEHSQSHQEEGGLSDKCCCSKQMANSGCIIEVRLLKGLFTKVWAGYGARTHDRDSHHPRLDRVKEGTVEVPGRRNMARMSFTRAEICGQGGLRSQRGPKREEAGETYSPVTLLSQSLSHWPPHWLKPMGKPKDEGAW